MEIWLNTEREKIDKSKIIVEGFNTSLSNDETGKSKRYRKLEQQN